MSEKDFFEKYENAWESSAQEAEKVSPIKKLKVIPQIPGITKETARFLKLKSLIWMLRKDQKKKIRKEFFRHPIKYSLGLFLSLFKKTGYVCDKDFYFYGIHAEEDLIKLINEENALLVLGFSYCEKPFECPSGRFTDQCIRDPNHLVCRQCFIGKCLNLKSHEKIVPLLIPTVHYISEKIIELTEKGYKICFLITACEMTLKMFADFGNLYGIKGIGVRLDGRICNTMKAFALSEEGIKPGLTILLKPTEKRLFKLLSNLIEHLDKQS